MPILILLPLDGHNFKIITKLLQNSFLFMKTTNQDLVPREFFLLIRWNMRIIERNWGRKFCLHLFQETQTYTVSVFYGGISVPTVIGLMCVKNVKYLKFRFSWMLDIFKSYSVYFKSVSLWCTILTLISLKKAQPRQHLKNLFGK